MNRFLNLALGAAIAVSAFAAKAETADEAKSLLDAALAEI